MAWAPQEGDPVRKAGSYLQDAHVHGDCVQILTYAAEVRGGGGVPIRVAGTKGHGGGLDNKGPVRREAPIRKAGALGSEVGLA